MALRPALCLALAASAASARPQIGFEGEAVATVRLEGAGDNTARPERYLELAPGEPLRLSTVSHVVEVLYATGAYADVVVDAQRTPAGLAVVFRLVPAPRLGALRVQGDRVLSPAAVRRVARLVRGEPLWPSRLERAARDVALHLSGRGYLEAGATAVAEDAPHGSVAVFAIHAGPRARVGSVRVTGLVPAEEARLRALLRPLPGHAYVQKQAERAAEAVRKRLVAEGRWRARVEHRDAYDPSRARVDLVFEVQPGLPTQVEFRGARVAHSLRARVEAVLREGGVQGDALEQATELLEAAFRREGHRAVTVSHREETRPGRSLVVYEIQPGPAARVASVAVVGAAGLARTRPGTPLEDRLLEEDARALTRILEEDGHLEARVEAETPDGGGLIPVVFRARPGPRTLVAAFAVETPEPLKGETAPRELRCREGRPYRARDLALDRDDLAAAYRNAGYLQAQVTPVLAFSEDRSEARITLRVEPGPRTTVDHVVVAGLLSTREAVVRRELLVKEGEALDPQKLLESQRRLAALGIFQRVTIGEMDPGSVARRSLVVNTVEAPRTTLAYGLGYAERDLLRASAEVTRRNLGGLDRSVSAFVRASFRGSRLFSTYREPYLFGKKHDLLVTVFREEEDREGFDFLRFGGLLQTDRPLAPRWSAILRYSYQQTDIFNIEIPLDEVDRQFRSSTVSGPSASLVNDTRDDPLDPHHGRFLSADLQLSAKVLGGDSFLKAFVQAASYRRLSPRATLALGGRLGFARTLGYGVPIRLPLPDRFFAGGDYSLRGFRFDRVGPIERGTSGVLVPTGGNALLLGNAELRLDAGRSLSLAAFSDVGTVYPLISDFDLGDVRWSAGLGVRYRTALGPIRIDYGRKLNRRPGESLGHVHFTIGHAF